MQILIFWLQLNQSSVPLPEDDDLRGLEEALDQKTKAFLVCVLNMPTMYAKTLTITVNFRVSVQGTSSPVANRKRLT